MKLTSENVNTIMGDVFYRDDEVAAPAATRPVILVSDTDIRLVEMVSYGHSKEDLIKEFGVSADTIGERLKKLRYQFECDTNAELVAHFLRSKMFE